MNNSIKIKKLEDILHDFRDVIHFWWNPPSDLGFDNDEDFFEYFDNSFDEKYSICFKKIQKLINCKTIYNYNHVTAYNMFRRSKSSENWETMSAEDKQHYQMLADQENSRRRKKAEVTNMLEDTLDRLTENFTLDSYKPLLKTYSECNVIIPENMLVHFETIFSDFLNDSECYNALEDMVKKIDILFSYAPSLI